MNRVGKAQVILHVDKRYAMQYGPFTQVDGSYNNPSNEQAQPSGNNPPSLKETRGRRIK